jgi:hypothetical protein
MQLLLWAPAALAGADLLLMLAGGPELVRALHHNADVAAAEVLGELYGSRGAGSIVTLGSHPWYESLWFMRASAWVPGHRELWTLAPFVFGLAAIAALARTAWVLFGAWAGAMVAALLVASSSAMRIVWFTADWHGGILVHAVFLCVVLVVLTRRSRELSTLMLAGAGVAVALVTALTVPDRLAFATAIVPFAGAALILWWRTARPAERRVAIFALVTMAAAVGIGELAQRAMEHAHVAGTQGFAINFADYTRLGKNVQIFFAAFTALGGGTYFGRPFGAGPLAHFVQAALTLLALGLVARRLWIASPRLVDRARPVEPAAAAREAYLLFWSLALVAVLGAFLVTDVSWDVLSSRYLAGAFLALAALVPVVLATGGRSRPLLAGGLALYVALMLGFHVERGPGRYSEAGNLQRPADELAAWARAAGLRVGYGGFDDAPVLTWLTDERVEVFQVSPCGAALCPYGAHVISTWYRPRPNTRTFLVARPAGRGHTLTAPYARAGTPVGVRHFGPLVVYVYDHDIAADFGSG